MAERTNEEWLAELGFGRLGVKEGSEGLEFRGEGRKAYFCGWGCGFVAN